MGKAVGHERRGQPGTSSARRAFLMNGLGVIRRAEASAEADRTVLAGTLDLAALQGLLGQLRDLGLSVTDLRRLPAEDDEGGLR
jgi:hypothetical protein